jgi:malonyl-CoA O-methyltransferase
MGNLRGKAFLDVGCGTGRWLAEASTLGARILGVDFCAEMLTQAQRKMGIGGRLSLADSRHLPFRDGCADMVICSFSLGYVDRLDTVLNEVARVVKPGGTIYASDFHPEAHHRGWTRSLRNGDQILEIRHHLYSIEELMRTAQGAGLKSQELFELKIGEPERLIFRNAGKESLFDEACKVPAVFIAHWKRRITVQDLVPVSRK